jgi:Cu/Zn superoxide dismutase
VTGGFQERGNGMKRYVLIIHQGTDDMDTDPGAGPRIACAVIVPAD